MGRLIKLQLRNIFQGKLIYICLILMILLGPIATLLLGNALSNIISTSTICDEILSVLSVGIIETIFIALVSCSDFNDGTTKNIIARGYTRNQLLFSKYIAILISLLFMHLVTILFVLILLFKNKFGYSTTFLYTFIEHIGSIIVFTIFYTTMSFLLEKNGTAILACLFVPQLITPILLLLKKLTHVNVIKLWIDHGSTLFLDKPTLNNLGIAILYYAVYTIIFIVIGTQILKRKEIK